jgi:hypothetical protein
MGLTVLKAASLWMGRRRLIGVVVAALALLAAGPVATAMASVVMEGSPGASTNNTTPTFSGSATDFVDPVTLNVYQEGASAGGSPVRSPTTEPAALSGAWSVTVTSPLEEGTYTAVAEQTELGGLGETSMTTPVTFRIDTTPPLVSLNSVPSPSNDATPTLTGGAGTAPGDHPTVTLTIYSEGTEVVSEDVSVGGEEWSFTSPHLPDGTYTARATQSDQAGETGFSAVRTFTVATTSPTVTLEQPVSPSNNTRPSFSGTASDTTPVVVHIYNASDSEVTSATATASGGSWSTENESSLSSGAYTAIATQASSLENPQGISNPVSFTVNTAPPIVTLNSPAVRSNNTTPSFTGFASDTMQVSIQIYSGSHVSGWPVSSATAEGNGGDWISGSAGPELSSGQYTAVAIQQSSIGNPAGISAPVTFTVETGPPNVTLNQPKSPSKNTTPSFTGTASDTAGVTIDIYSGPAAQGQVISTAAATGTGGGWSSGQASPALSTGQYTAVAIQESSLLGNPAGISSPVTFTVDTRSPTVTLNQPPSPSKDTTPSFTGAASDTTKVVVHIYNAANLEVTSATATPSGGSWSTENESSLSSGAYTAIATQASSLENPQGISNPVSFTVNTAPPTVTLNSPAVRSNNTMPSFTGTASDTTQVTIAIYKGSKPEGTVVSTTTAPGTGGAWASSNASPALGKGQYTAIAAQPSSLGNPTGKSSPVTFEVDPNSPTVTLNKPPSPSNNTTPTFTGTASDTEPVTIRVYKGTKVEGTPVSSAVAEGNGGAWSSGGASPSLSSGTYIATATQPSSVGNAAGVSIPVTFIVETASPRVTLKALATQLSNNTTPSFTGTASDTTQVTVEIYKATGAKPEGLPVSTATAPGTSAAWSSAVASPPLASGEYSAVATQPSSAGNQPGLSKPITFTVNTAPPTVILNQPKSPSNNTKPSFTGAASDTTKVVVHIYNSANAEVGSATETPISGSFTAGNKSVLSNGTYTATATQESSLGNAAGVSNTVTFTVDTLPPTVTLNAPPSPSNNTTPSFTGTASDVAPVTVNIYVGISKNPTGSPISTATATPSGGSWTSGNSSPELPTRSKQDYTAIATEKSSIGNPTGISAVVHFSVDPTAPTVILKPPPSWSNDTVPSFAGTASDNTPVAIRIYAGTKPEGTVVSTANATGTYGAWSSGPASPALPDGQYTAVASQHSAADTEEVGTSEHFTFIVDTVPPHVTLTSPSSGSSSSSNSEVASGSAGTEEGDLPHVTVQLFAGPTISGGQAPVQSITVNAVAGAWSATFGGLGAGTYTVRAQQPDQAGNVGTSAASTFVVTGSSSAVPAHPPAPPAASFTWFPSSPRAGESVSLVSSSTDADSPITAFAWDLAGTGAFAAGGPVMSTTFSTPGSHLVQLRVTVADGLSSVASETIPVSASLPFMQPFPIVRITSTGTRSGIKLRQLNVLASPGAQITVQCKSRACPVKSQTVKAPSHVVTASKGRSAFVEFRRFERSLAAGVSLEIRVTKAGEIGKYTRFVVRRGRVPVRFDACLAGVSVKPVGCPSS